MTRLTKNPVMVEDFSNVANMGITESYSGTATGSVVSSKSAGGRWGVGSDAMKINLTAAANERVNVRFDTYIAPEDSDRIYVRLDNKSDVDFASVAEASGTYSFYVFVGNTAGNYTDGVLTDALDNTDAKRVVNPLILTRAKFDTPLNGGIDWDLPIRSMYFRVYKKTDPGTVSVTVDCVVAGWEFASIPVGLNFDDNDEKNDANNWGQYAYMWNEVCKDVSSVTGLPRNWKFTLCTTTSLIDTTDRHTTAQLTEMHNAGLDIIFHGFTHDSHSLTADGGSFDTAQEITDSINSWYSWADALNFQRKRERSWASWPAQVYSPDSIAAMTAQGVKYVRSGGGYATTPENAQYCMLDFWNDALSRDYWLEIMTTNFGGTPTPDETDFEGYLTEAIANQAGLNIYGHTFVTTPAAPRETAYAAGEAFWPILDTYEAAGSIKVMQMTEAMEKVLGVNNRIEQARVKQYG